MLNTEIKKILFIVVLLYEIIEFISRIERRLVRQHQRLDHVQRPLLVFLEMFGKHVYFWGGMVSFSII